MMEDFCHFSQQNSSIPLTNMPVNNAAPIGIITTPDSSTCGLGFIFFHIALETNPNTVIAQTLAVVLATFI